MKIQKGIRRKILLNTTIILLVLSVVLVGTMTYFMTSLTDSILLDTLQPMAKTAAKSVEGNLHMMADRLFLIRDNSALNNPEATKAEQLEALEHAKGGIEFVWLGLYDVNGKLITGSDNSPQTLEDRSLLTKMTDTANLVIDDTTVGSQGLELAVGTPLLGQEGEIRSFLVGSYKYDVLNDVLSDINIGSNGTAFMVNENGLVMAHQDLSKVTDKKTLQELYAGTEGIDSLFEKMVSGQTGAISLNGKGGEQLFSFSPVRGTHWSLAITAPRSDFMDATNQAILTSIIITLVLLVLAILLTIRLAQNIQRPLRAVTDRISTLASGDLHSDIAVQKTRDETETLSTALQDTVHSINHYTGELSRVLSELSQSNLNVSVEGDFHGDFITMKDSLNQIIDFLNNIMFSLQSSSQQVSATSHLVSQNAIQVQGSSGSQSASLTQLLEETEAISGNIAEVDTHTNQVAQLIGTAVTRIDEANTHMTNMLGAMKDISTNQDEITKINKFLEDIAFQTNILALNAAVEAARAGEAGKGFAVVADEVRNLAAKSGESSKRTSEMIHNSQASIEAGSGYASQTADSLDEVMAVSKDISNITQQLTQAVQAQKASLETMSVQINQVNQLAHENLNSSETSAQASQTLTQQADQLSGMANQFKLKAQGGNLLEN